MCTICKSNLVQNSQTGTTYYTCLNKKCPMYNYWTDKFGNIKKKK